MFVPTHRLGHVVRTAARGWTGVAVVLAGTLAALAALFDLAMWVSIGAAIVAVLGGVRVLRAELVVPVRLEAIEKATARLMTSTNGQDWEIGSAFHLGAGRWVTASHLLTVDQVALILIAGKTIKGRVTYHDADSDMAVVVTDLAWPWRVPTTNRLLDRGEAIRVVGWMHKMPKMGQLAIFSPLVTRHPRQIRKNRERLITMDLVVQSTTTDGTVVLAGYFPPMGFGGAPAVETRTGRVVGLVTGREEGQYEHLNETYVAPLTRLPRNFH